MIHQRPAFSPSGEFVVRREFRFAGRDFRTGDEFVWRRMACSPRKLRSLYEGGFLMFKNDADEVYVGRDNQSREPEVVMEPTTEESTESQEGTPDETVTEEETGDEDLDDEVDAAEVVEKPKKKKKKKKVGGNE